MNTIYGHQHLFFFFREIFECSDAGISYKGREYSWNDIARIKRCSGSYAANFCYPGVKIYFKDGRNLWINGRVFTKAGQRPKFKISSFISGESIAFIEFLEYMKRKTDKFT
jgi:hypothetical protein